MATSFRYGPGGSYKTACAVWFDLLPALRDGRTCITNVHGMQPLEVIEERLGEKFPDSARLIRISSRNQAGFELWQFFFCWAPIGAFILIDECQQVFSTNAGFKMANMKARPFSEFEEHLPDGFSKLFHDKWLTVKQEDLDAGELDDCGRSRFDDQGRIHYPANFNDAFMEHRHYNWDIVMLTPDFGQVPKEVKGVAELAKQHKSKDGVLKCFNRKPRILEHDPTRTVSKATKDDVVYNTKVPLDVHLIYASTVTGNITKSGIGKNVFANPKFIFAILAMVLSFGWIAYEITGRISSDTPEVETITSDSETQEQGQILHGDNVPAPVQRTPGNNGVRNSGNNSQANNVFSRTPFKLGGTPDWFPFNNVEKVYVSGVEKIRNAGVTRIRVLFEVQAGGETYYISNRVLYKMGVQYDVLDECLVQLSKGEASHYFVCKPYGEYGQPDQRQEPELTNIAKQVELKPMQSIL